MRLVSSGRNWGPTTRTCCSSDRNRVLNRGPWLLLWGCGLICSFLVSGWGEGMRDAPSRAGWTASRWKRNDLAEIEVRSPAAPAASFPDDRLPCCNCMTQSAKTASRFGRRRRSASTYRAGRLCRHHVGALLSHHGMIEKSVSVPGHIRSHWPPAPGNPAEMHWDEIGKSPVACATQSVLSSP